MSNIKKYLDLTFNPRYEEVIISLFISVIFIIVVFLIGLYPNFFSYQSFLIDICIDLMLTQIALMGVLITALALLVTLFNSPEHIKKVYEMGEEPNVDILLNDFPYVSSLVLFHVVFSLIIALLMKSNLSLIPGFLFYSVFIMYIYFFINILVRITFMSFITVNVFRGIRSVEKICLLDESENEQKNKVKGLRTIVVTKRRKKEKEFSEMKVHGL